MSEKQARAREIAQLLSNNAHWNSHGRMIGMSILRSSCKLEIDDFGTDPDLQKAVRSYNETLTDYLSRSQFRSLLYSRHVS
jgi:hypothetical protein